LAFSHNCSQIAFADEDTIFLCDVNTQEIIAKHRLDEEIVDVQFSPNQHGLWLLTRLSDERTVDYMIRGGPEFYFVWLEMTEGGGFGNMTQETVEDPLLWVNLFSCGYNARSGSGQWVVDPRGNKLLWLPPNLRVTQMKDTRWNGNFLALVDGHHPEPIIIHLPMIPSPIFTSCLPRYMTPL
jgi:hypothetical protein